MKSITAAVHGLKLKFNSIIQQVKNKKTSDIKIKFNVRRFLLYLFTFKFNFFLLNMFRCNYQQTDCNRHTEER